MHLNDILAQPPSEALFASIVAFLGDRERPDDDADLRTLDEGLARWPDHIHRFVPDGWAMYARYGVQPTPAIRLCNALSQRTLGLDIDEFRTITALMRHVVHIDCSDVSLDDEVLMPMGQLEGLLSLDLSYTPLWGDAIARFARLPNTLSIHALDLRYTYLGSEKFLKLIGTPLFEGLHTLRLNANGLNADCVEALVGHPAVASLRILDLRDNDVGDEGARALASSPYLGQLTWLHLNAQDVWRHRGIPALCASTTLPLHIRKYWRR
ncbi:MAG: hypothetical protein AAFV53_25385 [Myxococcota bacterium]